MGSDEPEAGVLYSVSAMADQSRTTADCAVGTSEQSQMDGEERSKALVTELTRFCNVMAHGKDGPAQVAQHLMREHRTLQQNVFGLFLACVKEWAETPNNRMDARNEWTIEKCRAIVAELGEFNLRPPFI